MMKKAGGLYITVAFVSGALVSALFCVPVSGQSASLARVSLQAEDPTNSALVGDVLLQNQDGTVKVIGLAGAVPSGSTVVLRYLLTTFERTADVQGAFPSPGEDAIELTYDEVTGKTIQVEVTDPAAPGAPFNASFVVDFSTFSGDGHELINIEWEDTTAAEAAGVTPDESQVLLTQRAGFDEFEGLPGAVPDFAEVSGFSVPRSQVGGDEGQWSKYRVFSTRSVRQVAGQYLSDGNIYPWSIPNLNSTQPTITLEDTSTTPPTAITLYPESKLYLKVTPQSGSPLYATIQDDVSVDVDASLFTFENNNTPNPDGTFPFAPPIIGRAIGPAGTAEPFSSVIATESVDGQTLTLGAGNVGSTGAVSFDISQAAITGGVFQSLDQVVLRLEDRLGNMRENVSLGIPDEEAMVFEGPTVTKAEDDAALAATGIVGRIEGVVEPASTLIIRAGMVDGSSEGGPFWLGTVQAATDDGSFTFDVQHSPTVDITVIDPAGNTNELDTLDVDTEVVGSVEDLTVTTAEEDATLAAAGLVGHIEGVVEPNARVFIYADSVGGLTAGGPFLLATVQAAADGSFAYDVESSPTVNITLRDAAGNSKTLPTLAIDNVAQPAVVNESGIKVGFPTTTITGTAELNSTIRVIGLSAVSSEILDGLQTGQLVASLPEGVTSGILTQTSTDADGNFSVSLSGIASQVVYVQVVDHAGNASQYTAVVLSRVVAGESLVSFTNLQFTLNGPMVPAELNLVVEDAQKTGTPMPNIQVVAFAEKTDTNSYKTLITDLDFPSVSQADGSLDSPLEIPTYFPDATEFNSSTFIDEFYLVAVDPQTGGYLGDYKVTAADGFDRVGPEISTVIPLIFTDDDFQLVQNGSESPDILNIRNIFPNFAPAGPRLPKDALNLIFVLADNNDDDEIDVRDVNNLELLDVKPMNALIAAPYGDMIGIGLPPGFFVPIPGANNLNLGYNFWNARTQTYSGHKTVFVALMDQQGNYSPDPVPVVLDVSTQDPNPDLITVGEGVVTGADGAVEPLASVAFFGDTTMTNLLGVTTANSVGAFSASVDTAHEAIVVYTRDQAGNESNPVNVKASTVGEGVPYVILDGFGVLHTPGGTLVGSAAGAGTARALAEAHDAPGTYYQLNADGQISGPIGSLVGSSVPSEDQIIFNQPIARDLKVVATGGGKFSGYLLAGNGFVGTFGDAPFFGDPVRDLLSASNPRVNATNERVRLNGTIFLEDSNGNGNYDVFEFSTEDTNGNGILDPASVDFVWNDETQTMEEIDIPAEDLNGNGVLDVIFDAEGLFDASEAGIGFGSDLARDLEVVYANTNGVSTPVGYMILDGWGVIHHYGTVPDLQNLRVTPGYNIFRSFKLIVDASGEVQDIAVLSGLGQVYATPGGFLGAPAEDPEVPGGGGDLSFVLNPQPVYFGFDIARDIEVNPIDSNGDGVVGDGSDGFYVLDGYGGIHAIGAAPKVDNAPFLGFDIARDLKISHATSDAISVPSQ